MALVDRSTGRAVQRSTARVRLAMVVALGAWAPTVCGQTVSTTIAPAATPAPAPPAPSPEPACPPGTPPGCNCLLQCCTPGSLQLGDTSDGPGSFCTNKPFQDDYQMRIFERVPVQINLRDYCTDEILWTSYNAPKVDRFTLVEFPCSYRAGNCDYITDPVDQEQCKAGFDVYTKELNCTGEDSFFQKFVNGRICNKANFGRFGKNGNSEYFWEDGTEGVPGNPAEVGICNCNFSAAIQRASGKVVLSKIFAKKDIQNLTVGVPDGFIKEGMSTFYVEVVVGGRSTAERGSDTECMCTGPADISAACMCELGTKKIPYVYNNSFVPTLTALVSMRKGQLFYTNTFVKFNFESTGRRGCADCAPDYCFGVPRASDPQFPDRGGFPVGWRRTDFDLELESGKVCAVPPEPSKMLPDYYCRLPLAKDEVNKCSLKVYLAWSGTDRYDTALESSNMMFSKFTQMGVGNVAAQFLGSGASMIREIDQRISGRDAGGEMP